MNDERRKGKRRTPAESERRGKYGGGGEALAPGRGLLAVHASMSVDKTKPPVAAAPSLPYNQQGALAAAEAVVATGCRSFTSCARNIGVRGSDKSKQLRSVRKGRTPSIVMRSTRTADDWPVRGFLQYHCVVHESSLKLIEYGRLNVFTVKSKSAAAPCGESARLLHPPDLRKNEGGESGDSNHEGAKLLRSPLLHSCCCCCCVHIDCCCCRSGVRGCGQSICGSS